MSNVYSVRLVDPTAVTTGLVTLFTVPANHVYVVMSVQLVVHGGATPTTLSLRSNGTGTSNQVWRGAIAPDTTVTLTELRWVFEAGDDLRVIGVFAAAATASITVCGYDLVN